MAGRPTELYVCGKLAKVCAPEGDTTQVVDIEALLRMSTEERHVRALPVSMQRFMAQCVLAGYKFKYYPTPAIDIWRAWSPAGTPVWKDARGAIDFSGLMFVLDRIGFNEWLVEVGRRELRLKEGYIG